MIRYIKLKNYRSFTDLYFDLMSKNGTPIKFAAIYGENGSGKSNIISVFDVLYDTFHTMSIKRFLMHLLEEHTDTVSTNHLAALRSYADITRIIQNKTVGSTDNMLIEIGFILNGKNGVYLLEFNSDRIVHEKLEYTLTRNRGVYYDITPENTKINPIIFSDFKNDLVTMIKKFWGKHSVISLLNNAKEEYSKEYFETSVNPILLHLLEYINSFCIYMVDNDSKRGILINGNTLSPAEYNSGEIPASNLSRLDLTEHQLDKFFKSMNKNIRKVFYKRELIEDKIKYELYFTRYISGEERTIHYSEESCGTQNLVYLLPYCLAATQGHVVVIDEIDNGIHDILLCNMLKSLYKEISGQVIVTTHNTLLLNEYDFKDSFYFIEVDDNGNRKINTPSDFGYRIQPDSNVMLNYFHDRFKGLPWCDMNIDFKGISSDS